MNSANSIVSDRNVFRRNLPRHPVFMPQALPADFGKTPSQRAIVHINGEFLPRYGHGAEVLHVGDPAMGCLVRDADLLGKLGLSGVPHEKLPAIVAYSPSRRWLYLIESAHPGGVPGPAPPCHHPALRFGPLSPCNDERHLLRQGAGVSPAGRGKGALPPRWTAKPEPCPASFSSAGPRPAHPSGSVPVWRESRSSPSPNPAPLPPFQRHHEAQAH
ncbi:MAG: hypothetical protein K9N23_13465 [Akkermansiaceae bacterium]|nr:hypothetical protein [Akkermansiaceae bacterium]MCF7732692.1 hypothetical protein [Akkermansiaceae bacterium]